MADQAVLAFDFGGTKIAVGVADADSSGWLATGKVPTLENARESLRSVERLTDRLIARTDAQIAGIGVSFGGNVDSHSGRVLRSSLVAGWDDLPLAQEFSQRFGAPVKVVNDGLAGALGEGRFGAAAGLTDFVYLTVSTGIGGGIVMDGRPCGGGSGQAGEFGHMRVAGDPTPCRCGYTGCIEAIAAGPAIAASVVGHLRAGEPSTLAAATEPITARLVAEHARAGDALAQKVMTTAGAAVGYVLAELVAALDPQAIVVGGGVANSGPVFWDALHDAFVGPMVDRRSVELRPALHINKAPLNGALMLALEQARLNRAQPVSQ
ncbi:MAG: ROK family protein [Propionicimonas sp.]|nr:ROK family protein [Propionicimonas sp.]